MCNGIRRGRPVKAARHALRAPRSVVVRLSLSRRNAASESEEKAVVRSSWFVARKSSPSFRIGHDQISQRAALAGSAPTLAPIGAFFTSRGLLEAMSSGLRPANCDRRKKGACRRATSPFFSSIKIQLSRYRGDCTIRIRRRSLRLRIRLSVLHRV